jgi:hypothetical protein
MPNDFAPKPLPITSMQHKAQTLKIKPKVLNLFSEAPKASLPAGKITKTQYQKSQAQPSLRENPPN